MNRLAVLALLAVSGCLSSSEIGEPLDEDVYYIGVPAQYATANDCFARSRHCSFALTLCHNGRAALRIGGLIQQGIYAMHGDIARGTIETHVLALDLATLTEPEGQIVQGVRWELDTEGWTTTQVYSTVDCRPATIERR
jgi:hypothetical protein